MPLDSIGEPTRGRKKIVWCILPTMIIPEEETVQLAANLLTSTLQMMPTQENTPAPPLDAMGVADAPTLNSPNHTEDLPPASGTGTLIDTAIVLPST